MTRIILNGCNGKMGQVITRLAAEDEQCEIVAGLDINDCLPNTYPVFTNPEDCNVEADVIIDFSHPSAFDRLIKYAKEKKLPIVVATTGLSQEQREQLKETSKKTAVFFSANMSLGINLLIALAKKTVAVLGDAFDIEIIEQHHNQKLDAPSGTALAIADAVCEASEQAYEYVYDRHSVRRKRRKNEIGLHAVRGGTIVGKHDIMFAGQDEIITLSHEAASKEVFAVGSLKAAKFMNGKTDGYYSMNELIGELV